MESDPTLHTKSMDVQLQTVIVDAFRNLSPLPPRSYLVIIDGLDECHDKATQQSILRLLFETITVHKLPLRFLIGSRPESHIRACFDQESLYTITQWRRLVPCTSAQIFIIPKLQNIYCELFFPCIEHLPYCYSVRHYYHFFIPDWSLWEHLSHAIPTEMIFDQLRSIRSVRPLIPDYSAESMLDTLDIIIKWLQVSVSDRTGSRQTL